MKRRSGKSRRSGSRQRVVGSPVPVLYQVGSFVTPVLFRESLSSYLAPKDMGSSSEQLMGSPVQVLYQGGSCTGFINLISCRVLQITFIIFRRLGGCGISVGRRFT